MYARNIVFTAEESYLFLIKVAHSDYREFRIHGLTQKVSRPNRIDEVDPIAWTALGVD